MSMYVKKSDGTIVESQCETVKVTENTLKKYLDNVKTLQHFTVAGFNGLYSDLIKYEDTENVISMEDAFAGISSDSYYIRGIPLLNTSNVTNMRRMFGAAVMEASETIPLYDTSNVTNMSYMFSYFVVFKTNNIDSIRLPSFNTSKVTNMEGIFASTAIGENPSSNIRILFPEPFWDTSNVTNMRNMFSGSYKTGMSSYDSYLTRTIPLFNTAKVTNIGSMFYEAKGISIIPAYDFSSVTYASYMFYNCNTLEEIHFTGLKVSFDISASTKFTELALVEILNNLGTPTSSQTLTMGATNLAKLSDEEKAIATDKGWTLK